MKTVRTYLKRYREALYLMFFLPQLACVSWGLGSGDWLYRLAFAGGIPFLLLSMAGEDYTARDMLYMGSVAFLSLWALVQNGSRSLILACMAVYGAKNLNLERILRYIFWCSATIVAARVCLCAAGILPNETVYIPKGGVWHTIYCYGFKTPNNLYFHLIIILMLAMVLYGGRICRTPVMLAVSSAAAAAMYGAYRGLLSRSGWMCFVLLAAMYVLAALLSRRHGKALRYVMTALILSPAVLCLLNWGMVYLYGRGWEIAQTANQLLTGRLSLAWEACSSYGISLFGSRGATQLDMLYVSMLLNYGIVLSVIAIGGYTVAMWRLCKKEERLALIAMTVMAAYSFMEVNAVNPMWNPFLLYMTIPLFGIPDRR